MLNANPELENTELDRNSFLIHSNRNSMATHEDFIQISEAQMQTRSEVFANCIKKHRGLIKLVLKDVPLEDAKDIEQDTYESLWRTILKMTDEKFNGIKKLQYYIARSLHHQRATHYKNQSKSLYSDDIDHIADDLQYAIFDYELHDLMIDYHESIRTYIGNQNFDILHTYCTEGYNSDETAKRLGLTEPTVRTRLPKIRKKLEQLRKAGKL